MTVLPDIGYGRLKTKKMTEKKKEPKWAKEWKEIKKIMNFYYDLHKRILEETEKEGN